MACWRSPILLSLITHTHTHIDTLEEDTHGTSRWASNFARSQRFSLFYPTPFFIQPGPPCVCVCVYSIEEQRLVWQERFKTIFWWAYFYFSFDKKKCVDRYAVTWCSPKELGTMIGAPCSLFCAWHPHTEMSCVRMGEAMQTSAPSLFQIFSRDPIYEYIGLTICMSLYFFVWGVLTSHFPGITSNHQVSQCIDYTYAQQI